MDEIMDKQLNRPTDRWTIQMQNVLDLSGQGMQILTKSDSRLVLTNTLRPRRGPHVQRYIVIWTVHARRLPFVWLVFVVWTQSAHVWCRIQVIPRMTGLWKV